MNQIVISNAPISMTSREIAELTGKEHRNVMADIRVMFGQLSLSTEGYAEISAHPQNGQKYEIFKLPKALTLTLVSGYNVAMRKTIIDRWLELELEQAAAPQFTIPKSLSEALRLAADQADTIERQQSTIAIQAPKVEAFTRISQADGSMCIRDGAKLLQMRPIDLTNWLSQHQWIYHRAGKSAWLAYQDKIQSGYMEHKCTTVDRPDGSEKVVDQARLTSKGVARIAELLVAAAPAQAAA